MGNATRMMEIHDRITPTEDDILETYAIARVTPSFTPKELAEMFPEAVPVVQKLKKQLEKRLNELVLLAREFRLMEDETLVWLMIGVYVDLPKKEIEDKIRELDAYLFFFEHRSKPMPENHIDLDSVKTVAISTFIKFNRMGFAKCIWHNEKTSSLKWYPQRNYVHCFGCGVNADVIAVVQQLKGIQFQEAIRELAAYGKNN